MEQVRAQTTSKNGEISCSIEETNRIRAALGLKPLRVKTSESIPQQQSSNPRQLSTHHLRERIQASRAARRHRSAAIAPRSIAEQSLYEEEDDDLKAWVDRSRVRSVPKTPIVDEQGPVTSKQAKQERGPVGNVAEEFDLSTGETKILMLRDVDIVDNRDDVLEDHITAAEILRKKRDEEINGMVYDGTDTTQFEKKLSEKEGVQSVAHVSRVVENDYESDAVFRKVKKRAKKRRKRDHVTVIPGTVDALRKAADSALAQESDDDDHYELLRKATAKAAERRVEGTVNRILKAVENAERGGDEEMEDGARVIREEMTQFLGVREMDESDSEDLDEHRIQEEDRRDTEGSSERDKTNGEIRGDVQMEDRAPDASKEVAPEASIQPPAETIPETGLETNGMTGIAATLARLRTKGELKHKPLQKGRARDKRFDEDAERGGKKEIKLSYLDEFGNQLTPKEAFRVLCHSFHGKGPGQNKREKRLRKILEAAKKRSMQGDDTPLASTAALKAETRRLGSAHVVLSGVQALQGPLGAGENAVTRGHADGSKE